MVHCKCLRHPDQRGHVNGETIYVCWIARVSATVARPKQSSLSSAVAPRRSSLRKPHPVWTTTAIRAVAPAADEVVAIRRPPNHAALKPCCNNCVCTAVRLHMTRSCAVACRRYRNLRNPWVSVQDVVLNS